NRGSKSADNVQVSAFFSEGIEATQVMGQRHQIEPGKVTLEPIVKLGPSEQIVVRIIARAAKAGNHTFRAEVQCPSLEAKISSRKTTRFYGEDSLSHPASQQNSEPPAGAGSAAPSAPGALNGSGGSNAPVVPITPFDQAGGAGADGAAADKVTPSHAKPV